MNNSIVLNTTTRLTMKKRLGIILLIALIATACGAIRIADVSNLSEGMTKAEVDNIMGRPVRLLSTSYMQNGASEVYEYITYRQESYAVEYWNGRLSGYDFMYENAVATPPAHVVRPPSNPARPSRPSRPSRPENNRPEEKPGHNTGGRPSVSGGGSRPDNTNNNNNSNNNTGRPNNNTSPSRPSYNGESSKTRTVPATTTTEKPTTTTEIETKE